MYFGSEAILDALPPDEGSMREWGSRYLPSASALGLFPMQRVNEAGRVFVDGFADARSQAIFANMLDCIAVRSRAAIFAEQVRVVADQVAGPMRCLSLGSGAAVPLIDALSALHFDGHREYDLVLVDLDLGALKFAEQLAGRAGFGEHVRTVNDNIVRASRALPHDHFHLVDLLGVWEYGSDRACASMLKSALAHVIPGGRIIVSNMLADRPQLHFNQRGVGWPSIKPRTIEQMVHIALRSGVQSERVQVSVAGDGVYGVMSIAG